MEEIVMILMQTSVGKVMGANIVKNPWTEIPLSDYEGHMTQVAQAQLVADIFEKVLRERSPRSVAVIGCAGGNGFERVDPKSTPRVVGVDINPDYIAQARMRFSARIPQLELYVEDIQTAKPAQAPVDVVFAALVFEYVEAAAALSRIRLMLNPGGVLVAVVQLPNAVAAAVTPSRFSSLQVLVPCMRLVSPDALREAAESAGFESARSRVVDSLQGKRFHVHEFLVTRDGAN